MSVPQFYRFECPCGHGCPKIGFMRTERLAGEAGDSEKAADLAMTEYFYRAINGEEPTLEKLPLFAPGVTIEEKGSKWPDVIGHGTEEHPFIFSERVISAMKEEGITGFTTQPVKFEKIRSKKLRETEPPPYFCITVTGRITIVKKIYDKTDEGYVYVGEVHDGEDRSFHKPRTAQTARFVPIADTWDGSDWLLMRNHGHFRHYACSRKLVELAYREKWTNCSVKPMDNTIGDREIDYALPAMGKLPERWYSDRHPAD